jgi:DNA-binding NarL/FixJ family response regulator
MITTQTDTPRTDTPRTDTPATDTRHEHPHNGRIASIPRVIGVLVADDHPAVRSGLVQLLESEPGLDVRAVCVNAESAVASARSQPIDVAVLDYSLPGHSGLWACRQLKQTPGGPAVVIFSAFADDHLAACAAVAGADAVLNKGVLGSELCDAVRAVARGQRLLIRVARSTADALRHRLDERDQMLFGMLLSGTAPEHIRQALCISEDELSSRIEAMLARLEALPGQSARGGPRASRLVFDRMARASRWQRSSW